MPGPGPGTTGTRLIPCCHRRSPPPQFALSDVPPVRVRGVALVALPVLARVDEDGPAPDSDDPSVGPTLGPGTAELVEEIELDLFVALAADGADGTAGQVTRIPVAGVSTLTNQALTTVLLVGVGDGSPSALRRARRRPRAGHT